MIRLHMALPGVGLAIDVAPEHVVAIIPCDEGVVFDSERYPRSRCIVRTVDGDEHYVEETRAEVRALCEGAT